MFGGLRCDEITGHDMTGINVTKLHTAFQSKN